MGLGGYLTWTALAREIYKCYGIKSIPLERHGNITKLIKSPIFYNNPHFIQEFLEDPGVQLQLNSKLANYCKVDTPDRAIHKSEKHIIETLCEAYNIQAPELKCELFLDNKEKEDVASLLENIPSKFITIEPHSNFDYTVNRQYPLQKWQEVIDEISNRIPVVQVGAQNSTLLDNVIDLRGKTTFRTVGGIIGKSCVLLSSEGGLTHLCTAFNTPAIVILTGYQSKKMIEYPQNIYVDISSHGPCGMKIECDQCTSDANSHNSLELIHTVQKLLKDKC